jgi:hypothetical protein
MTDTTKLSKDMERGVVYVRFVQYAFDGGGRPGEPVVSLSHVNSIVAAAIAAHDAEREKETCEATQGGYDLMEWTFACNATRYAGFAHGMEPTHCPFCGKRINVAHKENNHD